MNDTKRIVLIALGISLLVAVLLPILFMTGMMGSMGGMMGGMSDMHMGGKMGMPWLMAGLVLLLLLGGVTSLIVGLRR